jgi:hypothetical protein
MRWVLAILVLMFFYAEVDAQRVIVKGGLNLSTVNVDFQHTLVKYGTVVSVGYEYTISKRFLIQSDFSFIQKGYKHEFEYLNDLAYGFYRKTLELNYLEIPIVLKYKFNTKAATYSFLVGPSIGLALGGNLQTYSVNSYRFPPDLDESEETVKVRFEDWPNPGDEAGNGYEVIENRIDFSLQFGGQIEFFNKVVLDIRYGLGFIRFYTLRYDETLPDGKISDTKNRGLQICVGIPFNVKKNKNGL